LPTRQPEDVGSLFAGVFRDRPDLMRVLANAFELETLPSRAELRLKDVDRVIGHTLSHVKDEQGQLVGAVLFFKDLTQVEQLEDRERLRDRLASLGEMAAGIAHELKNPLAGIQVMAGLLRRQVSDLPDAQVLVADIMSEAKLANEIVVEMLEFVRPIKLQVQRTNVGDILQQAVTLAEGKGSHGAASVHLALEPDLPPIDGDQYQLCQVFCNLLTNAFEALDGHGRVDIRVALALVNHHPAFAEAHAPTQAVIVDVMDDGPGVPADLIDKIFDPFFSTKPQGYGLGLSIVRKIVDAHDGRIDLTALPVRGTRFRVTLPVSSATSWFK
jgi:signal transduction histidine kinase